MIEIPEAINLSKQIDYELKNKKIKHIIADHSHHNFAMYHGNPEDYPKIFTGKSIKGAHANNSNVIVTLSDGYEFMFNYGIHIRYYTDDKLPKKHQLLIEFNDSTYVVCTVNMWGALAGYKSDSIDTSDTTAFLLSNQFDMNYLFKLLNSVDKTKHSIKSFLTTERRIPGFGNGILHDILFNAQIKPKRRLDSLNDDDIVKLYDKIKETLIEMTEKGGRDVEKDIYGKPGGYKTLLSRMTYGLPCQRCGGIIKKESYLGGSVYYCTDCQI